MEFLEFYMFAMTAMAVGFWIWFSYKVYKKFMAWRAIKLSKNLTDLYWDSLTFYINSGNHEGLVCCILLLKIFDEMHRVSAIEASAGYIIELMDGNAGELNTDQRQRGQAMLERMQAIRVERALSANELAIAKASASKAYPELIASIESFKSSYFKNRYPLYFN